MRDPASGQWVDVAPATPEAPFRLAVLVGAQLERATGGALKAAEHRVVFSGGGGNVPRLALVFRLRAPETAVLNPAALASRCVENDADRTTVVYLLKCALVPAKRMKPS